MINITQAFTTTGETVAGFLRRPGAGFYIPMYQREYSWDKENIDQLMEDICRGVEALLVDDKNAIRFLGTIIIVQEKSPAVNIRPQDHRALPTRIDNVIDGQQRISTLSLLACLLYQRLYELRNKFPKDELYNGLREAVDTYLLTFVEMFAVDLLRGRPTRKPVIIRGSVDGWTFEGEDAGNYTSDVAFFLASFIRAVEEKAKFPTLPGKRSQVGSNLRTMADWLSRVVNAHEPENEAEGEFPPAWQIIDKMSQAQLWQYDRPELVEIIKNRQEPMTLDERRVCSVVQLLAFSHYLLERCCFTVIQPATDDWAFDMFQSLNATGTPLTAVETFKPLVVNMVEKDRPGTIYKDTKASEYFEQVDRLLNAERTAAQKNKLTNDYLTTLATSYSGMKLSSKFSEQRKWLSDRFNECETAEEREEFVRRMGNVATYYTDVLRFDPNQLTVLPGTDQAPEQDRKLAALCVLYLKDAGHRMANSILSRFYARILRDEPDAASEFVVACKAVAAFFTLWRAALPNTGLDDVYRQMLRAGKMSWQGDPAALTATNLKFQLRASLNDKGVDDRQDWLSKATQHLRYDNVKTVCRFALFVTSHDTITDRDEPGLMKVGTAGSYSYLEPAKWVSKDFKSIEHIAPQTPPDGSEWDKKLYEEFDFQRIGNLTLLPTEINSSAGNKRWRDKRIYYLHLAETDLDNLEALKKEAEENGVELKEQTIALLKNTDHKHHIKPIVFLDTDGSWDKDLVDRRSRRMCEIVWDRLHPWLE